MATKQLSPAERRKQAALASHQGKTKTKSSTEKKTASPAERRKKNIASAIQASEKQATSTKRKTATSAKRQVATRTKQAITVGDVKVKDAAADKKKAEEFLQDGQPVRVLRHGANPNSTFTYKLAQCRDCEMLVAWAKSKKSGRWYLCEVYAKAENKGGDDFEITALPWEPHFKYCGTDDAPDIPDEG